MKLLPSAFLAATLISFPAVAQTGSPDAAAPSGATPAEPAAPQDPAVGTNSASSAGSMEASQDRVTTALTSAGYSDVVVLGTAYVVQARTPEGETVTMIVDSQGAAGASGASGAAGAVGSSTPGAATSIGSSLGEDAGTANDLGSTPGSEAAPPVDAPATVPGTTPN